MRPVRPDPAPSRLGYRLQRLRLTRGFRLFVRRGLPALAALALTGGWALDERNRIAVAGFAAELRNQFETRPEFMVNLMSIDGVDEAIASDIRVVLPVEFPVSSFDLDLEEMRQTVEALPAVRTARLQIRPGGVLEVAAEPRVPVAVWRSRKGLRLLDAEGVRVGPIERRADRPDLPLVAGDGARAALEEGLAIFRTAAPIHPRMRGLVRMGERRWDIVLDRGQRILLPEDGAVAALDRIIALHEAEDLLGRDVAVVDFRNPARPTVRMGRAAAERYRDTMLTERTSGR